MRQTKKITFVKKTLADGSACKKCAEVLEKMESSNQLRFIDATVVADEGNVDSEGVHLANLHDVSRAPFFIVEYTDGEIEIFTIYFKFVKQVIDNEEVNIPLEKSA